MSGSDSRRRQKKLEKNRKKRAEAKQSVRKRELEFSGASLMRKVREAPFGPTFISEAIDDPIESSEMELISVLVTRRVAGALVPHLILVDRTCFGVKDATLFPRMPQGELEHLLESLTDGVGELRPCEPQFAQSVVFHALDYAKRLGFAPSEDFRPAMIEPRPESLIDTPVANRARPLFMNGPRDDVARIRARLDAAVGPDGYDFLEGMLGLDQLRSLLGDGFEFAEGDDFESEADEELEDQELDAEGRGVTLDTTGTSLENWTEKR